VTRNPVLASFIIYHSCNCHSCILPQLEEVIFRNQWRLDFFIVRRLNILLSRVWLTQWQTLGTEELEVGYYGVRTGSASHQTLHKVGTRGRVKVATQEYAKLRLHSPIFQYDVVFNWVHVYIPAILTRRLKTSRPKLLLPLKVRECCLILYVIFLIFLSPQH
jgi:hypothetical protein